MDAFTITVIELALVAAVVVAGSYLAGRLHQKYRQDIDADDAFRSGYDQAAQFLLEMTDFDEVPTGADPVCPKPRLRDGARHRSVNRRRA
jgi:hypothetical protein